HETGDTPQLHAVAVFHRQADQIGPVIRLARGERAARYGDLQIHVLARRIAIVDALELRHDAGALRPTFDQRVFAARLGRPEPPARIIENARARLAEGIHPHPAADTEDSRHATQ